MVNIKKRPIHIAKSRIEADSWVASIGKRRYPNYELIVRKQGVEWHVYKG